MSEATSRFVDDRGIPLEIKEFLPVGLDTALVDNKENHLIKPLLQKFTELSQKLAEIGAEHPESISRPNLLRIRLWLRQQKEIADKITRLLSTNKEQAGGTKNKKRNKKYSKKRSKRSRSRCKQRRSKRSLSKSRSKRSKRR